jgi:rhamnosyltransferase subunit B
MATILFGWELGSGFGHVRPLLAVARELAARGHKPVFAVRNTGDSWRMLRHEGFPVFQGPMWQERPWCFEGDFSARTFADILAFHGWDDPDVLESLVRGWDELVDRVRPALIVVDHAPALVLAGFRTIPVVHVGTGWAIPPHDLPEFPVLNPDGRALVPQAAVLASVAEVQRRRGRPAPPTLPALYSDGARFITVFPELDTYADLRPGAALGPLEAPPPPAPFPPEPRWFAYFAADWDGTFPVLRDLVRGGIPGQAFVRGASAELRADLRAAGVNLLDKPAVLKDALRDATVLVHNAGTGSATVALGVGRPQVLLPAHLESWQAAQALERMGVGAMPSRLVPPDIVLLRMVRGDTFTRAAMARAESIRDQGPCQALPRVVAACEKFLSV